MVWFRKREDISLLGAGFGLSRATSYRYHGEGLRVLAAQAPDLTEALQRVTDEGWAYVILDGTVIASDRDAAATSSRQGRTDRPVVLRESSPARREPAGGDASGRATGVGIRRRARIGPRPERRACPRPRRPVRRGLPRAADPGRWWIPRRRSRGPRPGQAPASSQVLHTDNRAYNALLRGLRAPGERGCALLKTRWKALQHVTACPHKIGDIGKAALVLTHIEHKYIPC